MKIPHQITKDAVQFDGAFYWSKDQGCFQSLTITSIDKQDFGLFFADSIEALVDGGVFVNTDAKFA